MTRTGWQPRIAIREGADGYVYIYLARQDSMEGAEEVCTAAAILRHHLRRVATAAASESRPL